MGRVYVFKKRWKRVVAGIFDTVGSILFSWARAFKKISSHAPERILIIRLDSLGDAVLTLPAIQVLKRRFPKAKIDFLVSTPIVEFYQFLFPNSAIHAFEKSWLTDGLSFREWVRDFFPTANKLRAEHFDLGIDFRGDLRNILLMTAARIPNRWGKRGTGGEFLLTRCLPVSAEKHEVLENVDLVQGEGAISPVEFPGHSVPSRDLETIGKVLARVNGQRKIVIHPGAGYPSKRWPGQNFVELANRLREKGLGVPIFIGSGKEEDFLASYGKGLGKDFIDLTGKTSLTELLALLDQVDLFIGNDSGPSHLAAFLDRKMVVVFSGTNDFHKWAPWSRNVRIVNHSVPCSPCEEKVCPLERHFCLEDISVEEVFRAAEEILAS